MTEPSAGRKDETPAQPVETSVSRQTVQTTEVSDHPSTSAQEVVDQVHEAQEDNSTVERTTVTRTTER